MSQVTVDDYIFSATCWKTYKNSTNEKTKKLLAIAKTKGQSKTQGTLQDARLTPIVHLRNI